MAGFTIPTKGDKVSEEPKNLFKESDIEQWMEKNESVSSSICALFVGNPKSGKSGVAMDSRTEEEKKNGMKIVVIEMNADNGCRLNKKEFHNDDPSIIVLDPREVTVDLETGDYKVDYKKTLAKIKATLTYLNKSKDKLKLKAIIFDGADIFLSEICEGQMRIDENIDVTGGVQMRYWKKRNVYFYEVMNMFLSIDVDKYILTHYKKDLETQELTYGVQKDFPDKVHQIVEFRKDGNKFFAKLVADRRDVNPDIFNKEILIYEIDEDGKKNWKGYKL